MRNHTIIVGGGLAGLAAATALAERDVKVTLLESRPRLGGRASSFVDRHTQTQIDNCQHVSMGCCTNFEHFCKTVGLADFFREERSLNFIGPDGHINRFSAAPLPAPFHFMFAFRRLSYLDSRDRKMLAKGLQALARLDDSANLQQPFLHWLQQHQQTPAAIERFWNVVLVSALSESLDRIDTAHARKVFVDAFLANRNGWKVRIPTVSLDELYGPRLTGWLAKRDAEIRLSSGVERFIVNDERIDGVQLQNGQQLAADHYILAVPHHRVFSLLPESLRRDPMLANIERLEAAPISSVHLWFDRPITQLPHAVFVERVSQWMFNRSLLQSSHSVEENLDEKNHGEGINFADTHYYQIVISASRSLREQTTEETIEQVVAEMGAIWPDALMANLVHSRLVTEHKAVFSVLPGVEAFRPPQQSPIANLQLAGDWTKTGWPGTMESAVRSGYLAAENILSQLGRTQSVLQPDLRCGLLSKLLLGL